MIHYADAMGKNMQNYIHKTQTTAQKQKLSETSHLCAMAVRKKVFDCREQGSKLYTMTARNEEGIVWM